MKEEIGVLDHQVDKKLNRELEDYVKRIRAYYRKNKCTSPVHIDSLIIIYRLTDSQMAFNLLFECHKFLLLKIVRERFELYKSYLIEADMEDLLSMAYGEFVRRVQYYQIPPQAPFSKYIKLYLKKWVNVYIKLMINKRNKEVLDCDYYKPEE